MGTVTVLKKPGPFNEFVRGTVGASGTVQVELGPSRLFTWRIRRVTVQTSTNVKEPIFTMYVDSVAPPALGTTYTGSGDSSDEDAELRPGQKLIGVWTSADVGAIATLSVFGERTPI